MIFFLSFQNNFSSIFVLLLIFFQTFLFFKESKRECNNPWFEIKMFLSHCVPLKTTASPSPVKMAICFKQIWKFVTQIKTTISKMWARYLPYWGSFKLRFKFNRSIVLSVMFVRSRVLLNCVVPAAQSAPGILTARSATFLYTPFYWFHFTMHFQTIKPFNANLLSFYSFRDPSWLALHYLLWNHVPQAVKHPATEEETLETGQVWNPLRQVCVPAR